MPQWKLEGSALVEDTEAVAPVLEVEVEEGEGLFDPAQHTIDEVKQYLDANPDDTQRVYDAEAEGKARATLLAWLTSEG